MLKALRLPLTPTLAHNEEWDWLIAPHPEEHPSHDYIHSVTAKVYQRNVATEEAVAAEDALGVDVIPPPPTLDSPVDLGTIVPER